MTSSYGDAGSDFIFAGSGNDTANGGADNDFIDGSAGDDALNGDAGGDTAQRRGTGADTLNGGDGLDILEGGEGADTLNGGEGPDTVTYALSSAAVIVTIGGIGFGGEAQGDVVGTDIENIEGGVYNDVLTGTAGANGLSGSNGDDVLIGTGRRRHAEWRRGKRHGGGWRRCRPDDG